MEAGGTDQLAVNDIELEIIYISHGIPDFLNLGFIITIQGTGLFHTGDLAADDVSVSDLLDYGLPEKQLDAAFVPAYMFEGEQYHAHITEGIQARYVIPMHFSHQDPPQGIETNFPEAIVFQNTMRSWVLPSEQQPLPALSP